jgi:hypothetical protein
MNYINNMMKETINKEYKMSEIEVQTNEYDCWNDDNWVNELAELSAAENLYEKGLEVG